jgi:hypothetical protein
MAETKVGPSAFAPGVDPGHRNLAHSNMQNVGISLYVQQSLQCNSVSLGIDIGTFLLTLNSQLISYNLHDIANTRLLISPA